MFHQTVSLYNHRENPSEGECWIRCFLTGVSLWSREGGQFRLSGSSAAKRYGRAPENLCRVIIPYRTGYLPPELWNRREDYGGFWTIQPGDLLLPHLQGPAVLTGLGDLTGYAGVRMVTSAVFYPEGPLAHWEVTAE